jgi:ATP-dependent 26S proteasome regulatory subunit
MDSVTPQMYLMSTNLMMHMRTGNILVDTAMSMLLASIVMYILLCKDMFVAKGKRMLKQFFQEKYAIRYQGRVYTNRYNEHFSETFVALKDWVVAGIKNKEFTNVNTLSEIQLPRTMTTMIGSLQDTENDTKRAFNKSILILGQTDAIKHQEYDIYVRHETNQSGNKSKDDDELIHGRNEYTEHIITLSSNSLTTQELDSFVENRIRKPFQERRIKRDENKLFYYLFDKQDDDDDGHLCYEKYDWVSTKKYKHVISEHAKTVEHRINHFIQRPDWYIQRGMPYKITILLYGPPGCGKTSLIKAVANATRRHIKEIPLPRVKNRQMLMEIFHGIQVGLKTVRPQDCIYVFEEFDKMGDIVKDCKDETDTKQTSTKMDTDYALTSEDLTRSLLAVQASTHSKPSKMEQFRQSSGKKPPLSLGDILNVMDGLLEQNGIITFLTANRIDHLHKALTRPGRIDIKLKLDKATTASLKRIVCSVYDTHQSEFHLLDGIKTDDPRFHKKWSPAEIEEICFREPTLKEALSVLES